MLSSMFERHEGQIEGSDSLSPENLTQMNNTLTAIEKFWADQTNFGGGF